MKKAFCLMLALLLLTLPLVSCDDTVENQTPDTTDTSAPPDTSEPTGTPSPVPPPTGLDATSVMAQFSLSEEATDYVLIEVASLGVLVVELYPDLAPETVANFKKLVGDGFYDGLTFHRVIESFVIQGGDPSGDGTGGSSQTIKGEFLANGFENYLSHKRGVISMARLSTDYDSASSQFFICHESVPYLDGEYAAFGEVIVGMETVDAIASVSTDIYDKPRSDVVIQSMKFVTKKTTPQPLPSASELFTPSDAVTDYVLLDVANFGHIVLELYPEIAPETVANFKKLVKEGFYDGLIFHRVIKNFMIQGGDPAGNGSGGSSQTIPGEFSANGFVNDLSHKRGVISMARLANDYDSASSQFFICHADSEFLDGEYASFGEVVFGMDTVDAIASAKTAANDKPLTHVTITSATFVTKNEP